MPPRAKTTARTPSRSSTPLAEPPGVDEDALDERVDEDETSSGTARGGAGRRRTTGGAGTRLVIVESPAKAKTIAGYLGPGWQVESSIGHIRDLPRSAADVPAAHKGKPWARLGVDVDNGFEPLYIVTPDKRPQVTKLKALVKDASELYLATDEDREGEAIAWHLLQTLKPTVPVKRMVFHEITPQAIRRAVDSPREIDENLVNAQETRRILDRLYGYEVSPVLWKKVMPKLSAGRVQSVATRILVERERARMRFRSADYWNIEGRFAATVGHDGKAADQTPLPAILVALDGRRLATGRDFDATGRLTSAEVVRLDEAAARGLADRLAATTFAVRSVETKPYKRSPYAPFMTSTLQQEAGRKLRFSSQRTMQIAQKLYENGYITYMRTDSTNLSETALAAAREQARQLYGPEYVPDKPRIYTKKVKNAQEAHEAIRPAGDTFRTPGEVRAELDTDGFRLYELIWRRTVASQMADARGTSATVRLGGASSAGEDAEFAATGKVITFPGFLRAYVEGADDPDAELEDRETRLPDVRRGDPLTTRELSPRGHSTSPPPRFTEASLVKTLEELGIGRPSTYASIIGTIQDRGYVWKKGTALVPSFLAFAVVGLLENHFGRLVDYRFTASMEDDLDDIAAGTAASTEWLTRFYFGDDGPDAVANGNGNGKVSADAGLKHLVSERLGEIDAREVNSIPIGETDDGVPVVVRVGRYGPYVQHGERSKSVPEDLPPDELTIPKALELLEAPSGDRELGTDPETGAKITAKSGRFGPYVTTDTDPPRTASLLSTMSLETLTLDDARKLLTLPRVLGAGADGEEITAQNGRYGPYVKKGTESRSLQSEEQLFTVTLEEALALLAQPKTRGRRSAAEIPPLRELGNDPASGKPVVLKEGRFGPYVTDGETNASLRKGDEITTLTLERAAELLADRRARGPATPRRASRTTAKTGVKATTKATSTAKASSGTKAKPAAKAKAKGTGTRASAKRSASGTSSDGAGEAS
ncbi:type I DNA topoisomerase [Frankia sp. CNm7]|uniref:DNA topoisomerase 1 n=1 Tax=Frankia nepalensis TaxID=1836974 RepID=A0A937RTN7_9ACTN|nr:type I DNA topoisomerase [Frankia nepalensis]MBL7496258.1 type I DNA topoisomerase [Frankia nepalensis]MBL7514920.1 type I DNA topoisomerase [Frankia nepalensis]MBL7523369.1 type I DNA topoisomerase [Frankia nepalensis]MBL7633144.1 type I DNA topoisomerase [Frankia nepalensis]